MEENVRQVIERLRSYLHAAGNDAMLESVDAESGTVRVRLTGREDGSASQRMLHRLALEYRLREDCPQVRNVIIE